jgi:hypothetical protein
MALYSLEVHLTFAGPMPEKDNPAAPEVSQAHWAAVEALENAIREHGFTIVHIGHGSLRIGSAPLAVES